MIKFATSFIREKFSHFLNETMIAKICTKVHDEAANQIINAPKLDLSLGGINLGDVQETIAECSNIDFFNDNPTDEIMCIKKALKTAAGADVTGITAMAAAFMNPVCDV